MTVEDQKPKSILHGISDRVQLIGLLVKIMKMLGVRTPKEMENINS